MYNSRCQLARKCRCLIFIVKFQPLKLMMLLKLGKYMPDMVLHRRPLNFQSGPHATSKKNCQEPPRPRPVITGIVPEISTQERGAKSLHLLDVFPTSNRMSLVRPLFMQFSAIIF